MRRKSRLGIRWTIGDVSPQGFEALRLSVWGAFRLFGEDVAYTICVNSIPLNRAKAWTGELPEVVGFRDVTDQMPRFLVPHFDAGMAEGVAWKFVPLQVFPDRHELSLDNDCILWSVPEALGAWLEEKECCLLAEDVRACFGQFAPLCGSAPRNLGIRGLPPGFDLERRLLAVLQDIPVRLTSELDEQGLQVAALSGGSAPYVVTTDEVTICSPFPPHQPYLGRCGAHFVGLNAKMLGWGLEGRPAEEYVLENWLNLRGEVYDRVGLAAPAWGRGGVAVG